MSIYQKKIWITDRLNEDGYEVTETGVLIHRLNHAEAWGRIPEGFHVHHVNGNKRDNEPLNLIGLPAAAHIYLHEKRPELVSKSLNRKDIEDWYYGEFLKTDTAVKLNAVTFCEADGTSRYYTLKGNFLKEEDIILDRTHYWGGLGRFR